jgi:DNA-binding IscR family transcriptional regulator
MTVLFALAETERGAPIEADRLAGRLGADEYLVEDALERLGDLGLVDHTPAGYSLAVTARDLSALEAVDVLVVDHEPATVQSGDVPGDGHP